MMMLKNILSNLDEVKEHFSAQALDELFKPESYLGNIQMQIDSVLKAAQGDSQ